MFIMFRAKSIITGFLKFPLCGVLVSSHLHKMVEYRIYSINRPGRLLNFWILRVGAYSRWAFIRGWALIKFSPFSTSVVVYFTTKQ